ncbi:MAG: DNA adenine methylase [Gammaproteobacteria bacterium AqS3]|nr:DNA adenine methylase [Gammaproteobacteria bacterium AqS3]
MIFSVKKRRPENGLKSSRRKGGRKIAFGWYGGKYSHLGFLILNFPPEAGHFCDVFGGSAVVLMNVNPYPVETYNDIDSELVNFFRTLRDQYDELIRLIGLTPFSREELAIACNQEEGLSDLERARRFYVRARQTRTGLAQTSSKGRWAHCVLTSRSGMAGAVSWWLGSVEDLAEVAQRFQRVQIENASGLEVISRYDSPETFFYIDPPYVHSSRSDSSAYAYEMSDNDHELLAAALKLIKGKAAVSGYRTALYDHLFGDWRRVDAPPRNCHSVRTLRQESLWMNY